MRRDLLEDFCKEYVRELNCLRMEHRAKLSHGRQDLAAYKEAEMRRFVRTISKALPAYITLVAAFYVFAVPGLASSRRSGEATPQ
jgi:hypothetical protein